jgi:predicted MPP superfamily phosphohydrolase
MLSSLVSNNRDGGSEEAIIPERRLFMKAMTSSVLLPLAGCSFYGAYIDRDKIEVTEEELFFKDLPKNMDGFTIMQISDIHAGPFMDGYRLKGFVEKMNAMESDIIVITGDIINWGSTFISEAFDALSGLKTKKGVFAVLGNHDFYGDLKYLCSGLEKSGVQLLRNRYEKIYSEDKSSYFYLAGIDDPRGSWYLNEEFPFVKDTLKDVREDGFKVLLSHRPNVFNLASKQGVHLTLAGHTHGGQIIFPSLSGHGPSLASIAYEYDYGLYQKEKSFLYVNKGLGVVGPPIRVNCPREITRIVLRKKT